MDSPSLRGSSVSPKPILPLTPPSPLPRRHRLRWTVVSIAAGIGVILVIGGWVIYRAIAVVNTQKLNGNGERLSFVQQLTHIVSAGGDQLQGESEDRVNVLLMGIGGPGHDGPYLTDTLMVASIKPSTKEVSLISIPRDLVVDIPKYGYRKINNVLSFGRDQKYPGGGEALVVKVTSDLFNIPIQYYARIDFRGFADIIDRVGNVNITVDQTFTDFAYPTSNYGYQTIRFQAGTQTMNGDVALKYARSRHGNNGEGSDFARAKRQQKIMVALKDKILSAGTLLNPLKVSDILGSLGSHTQTNMEVWEMIRLANMLKGVSTDRIVNKVIQDGVDGLVKAATGTGGAFILIPKAGSYSDLQFLAQHVFELGAADREAAPIMVVNASKITAVGENTAQGLSGFGFNVTKTVNYAQGTLVDTVLIDGTAGRASATINVISAYRHVIRVLSPSEWSESTGDQTLLRAFEPPTNANANHIPPKFILVIGLDQPKPTNTLNVPTQTKTTTTNTNKATNSNKNTNAVKTNTNSNTTKPSNTNKATNANLNTNAAGL